MIENGLDIPVKNNSYQTTPGFPGNPPIQASITTLSYLSMPSLAGIRIESARCVEILESKISTQMIINFDKGKNVINDNIAPMPRTWNISGYIGLSTESSTLMNNPPFPADSTSSGNSTIGIYPTVNNTNIPVAQNSLELSQLNKQRMDMINSILLNKAVWFVDKYKTLISVAVEKIEFISDPTSQNKIPVEIIIKELIFYNGISYSSAQLNLINIQTTMSPNGQNPSSTPPTSPNSSATKSGQAIVDITGKLYIGPSNAS